MAGEKKDGLAVLREPFPPEQVSKLPKNVAKEGPARSCTVCGGYHRQASLHLDYVGHAALTNRLLDADPNWSWEPVAFDEHGLPAFDRNGGLWIRLTVCGVTRLGYGDAQGKQGGDAIKEAIGDALRNAAMRFGAALDLWFKGKSLGSSEPGDNSETEQPETHRSADDPAVIRAEIAQLAKANGWGLDAVSFTFSEWSQGQVIGEADAGTLGRFRDGLQTGKVAVAV